MSPAFLIPCPLRAPGAPATATSSRPPTCRLGGPGLAAAAAAATAAALIAANIQGASASLLSFPGTRPTDIGVRSERYLASCPAGSQNCVSSMDDVYAKTYVPSWTYANPLPNEKRPAKDVAAAKADLLAVLDKYEGEAVKIITQRTAKSDVGDGYYIYAEFTTKTFGFVDDVEFLFNPDGSTVEYRSASRLGKSDLDANRKRIQALRRSLMAIDNRWASTGY